MTNKYKVNLRHMTGYPGDGYHYVICDVCGLKIRSKDAILINDRFNTLNKMLVCPKDADQTNPQQYVRAFKERQLSNPRFIRSEGADQFHYIDDPAQIEAGDTSNPSGRTPSAPLDLKVIGASASQVELLWHGPDDSGSGAIQGYKIERETPVGGGFSTLVTDTATVAMYYKDTSVSASTQYNYRVSAINRDGTGSASNEASITTNSS